MYDMNTTSEQSDGSTYAAVTSAELKRAYEAFTLDPEFLDMLSRANTLQDYDERQNALQTAEIFALRNAINSVLKGREQ